MTTRSKVDRGIYKVGPCSCLKVKGSHHVYDVVVSTGQDRITGKYRQVWKRHHGNLTSAREFRRKQLSEAVQKAQEGSQATLNELFDLWLRKLERLGRAPKTIHGYSADADTYWRPTLGKVRVTKITLHDLDVILGKLTDRGLSPATVDHVHACISGAFSEAMRQQWITVDPTKLIQTPSLHNRRPIVPLPEDVLTLLRAAAVSDRPEMERVIWLAAITGARNSEIRGLRLTDFDLEQGRMGIERAISAEKVWTTKNRKIRDVALDDITVTVIEEQVRFMAMRAQADRATLAEDAYLFSDDLAGRKHWREDFVTKWFSKLADDAGVGQYTFKHLRKFMDTYGQELGFTDAQVASRAGHDPSVARKHYTGAVAATDMRLSTALAALLTPANSVTQQN